MASQTLEGIISGVPWPTEMLQYSMESSWLEEANYAIPSSSTLF